MIPKNDKGSHPKVAAIEHPELYDLLLARVLPRPAP